MERDPQAVLLPTLESVLRRSYCHHREAARMYRELARREPRELQREMLLHLSMHHERRAGRAVRHLERMGAPRVQHRDRWPARLWRRALTLGGLRCVGWWAERVERRDAGLLAQKASGEFSSRRRTSAG